MLRSLRRWLPLAAAAALALLALAEPALAQSSDEPWHDPSIPRLEEQKPYIQWLIGMLFVLACLFLAFKNPHRSHLD